MELSVKDISELLDVNEKTVYKWIKENKIPAYRINSQYKFNKAEIKEWVVKNGMKVSDKIFDLGVTKRPISLVALLKKGGVHYGIEGATAQDAIKNAVRAIATPPELDKEKIIFVLLEREEMMSTGIGKGIAIPHPRTPIIADTGNESVSICFLKGKVDFRAMDGELINAMFIVLSAKPERHVEILSKIAFLCQKDEFVGLLKDGASSDRVLGYIESAEKAWNKK